MPRTSRSAPGEMVFHVLNRGIGRQWLFDKRADYVSFEEVLDETCCKVPMRSCNYCIMPNHWHFILWPGRDGDLAAFIQRNARVSVGAILSGRLPFEGVSAAFK